MFLKLLFLPIGCDCSFVHAYLGISPNDQSVTYFLVNMPGMPLQFNMYKCVLNALLDCGLYFVKGIMFLYKLLVVLLFEGFISVD